MDMSFSRLLKNSCYNMPVNRNFSLADRAYSENLRIYRKTVGAAVYLHHTIRLSWKKNRFNPFIPRKVRSAQGTSGRFRCHPRGRIFLVSTVTTMPFNKEKKQEKNNYYCSGNYQYQNINNRPLFIRTTFCSIVVALNPVCNSHAFYAAAVEGVVI